jgi:hypothetical protein
VARSLRLAEVAASNAVKSVVGDGLFTLERLERLCALVPFRALGVPPCRAGYVPRPLPNDVETATQWARTRLASEPCRKVLTSPSTVESLAVRTVGCCYRTATTARRHFGAPVKRRRGCSSGSTNPRDAMSSAPSRRRTRPAADVTAATTASPRASTGSTTRPNSSAAAVRGVASATSIRHPRVGRLVQPPTTPPRDSTWSHQPNTIGRGWPGRARQP